MIWTIALILALSWTLGMVTDTLFGGFIHLLLAGTAILVLIAVFRTGKEAGLRHGAKAGGRNAHAGHGV